MSSRWQPGQSGNRAGRPTGSANKRSREILAEARERGIDPIQVLFAAIEHFMKRAKETTGEEQDGHMLSAVSVAKEAAPFCHPRLRAVELTSSDNPPPAARITPYTDEEFDLRWRAYMAGKSERARRSPGL
jgi:hypothetical protein